MENPCFRAIAMRSVSERSTTDNLHSTWHYVGVYPRRSFSQTQAVINLRITWDHAISLQFSFRSKMIPRHLRISIVRSLWFQIWGMARGEPGWRLCRACRGCNSTAIYFHQYLVPGPVTIQLGIHHSRQNPDPNQERLQRIFWSSATSSLPLVCNFHRSAVLSLARSPTLLLQAARSYYCFASGGHLQTVWYNLGSCVFSVAPCLLTDTCGDPFMGTILTNSLDGISFYGIATSINVFLKHE